MSGEPSPTPYTSKPRFLARWAIPLFALGFVIVVGGGIVTLYQLKGLDERSVQVDHLNQEMLTATNFMSLMKDAEAGQRGYVITGDPTFLKPYNEAVANARTLLDDLAENNRDDAAQTKRVEEAKRLTFLKFAELDAGIAFRSNGDSEAATKRIIEGSGKVYMDDLRKVVGEITGNEAQILDDRRRARDFARASVRDTFAVFLGLAAIFIIAAAVFSNRLKRSRDELDVVVDDRTRQLAKVHAEMVEQAEQRALAETERSNLLERIVTSLESERQRIGRDIHDQLGQRLTAFRMHLASLGRAVADDVDLAGRVAAIDELGQSIDEEIGYLTWKLRPTVLDQLGLSATLEAFVGEWSRHADCRAEYEALGVGDERFDGDIETHLYRMAQEALNNAAKHAEAENISVILERRNDQLQLVIEDDGCGFDVDAKKAPVISGSGLGLLGMKERTALIGGTVEIESAIGQGTTIFVRVPVGERRNNLSRSAQA